MIFKILIAALAVYIGWKLFFGGRKSGAASPSRRDAPPVRPHFPDHAELEACALLGVSPGADAESIRAAHRRLILTAHPDRGGSPELSRQLNAARDYLLRLRA